VRLSENARDHEVNAPPLPALLIRNAHQTDQSGDLVLLAVLWVSLSLPTPYEQPAVFSRKQATLIGFLLRNSVS
jgi:hypothetical protein